MHLPYRVTKGKWTPEDMQYALKHLTVEYIEDVAEHLGRTVPALKSKASLMGWPYKSTPTSE